MFHRARLKLTAWYLLIITFLSVSFSFVIFQTQSAEIERFAAAQRYRYEHRFFTNLPLDLPLPQPPDFEAQLITEARHRLAINLLIINLTIVIASGYLSYFLADRTLTPIKEMLDEHHQFISDASHELRTPITSLKTALEVSLRDKNMKLKEAKQLLTDNLADVNKLHSLSDSLLKLARYENPQYTRPFKVISLSDVISTAVHRLRAFAKSKQIDIEVNSSNLKLEADSDSLTDLLVILLDNAVKYSPEGKSVILSSQKISDGSVKITVTDQGPGISKKDLPHIFDRFYRSDTARTSSKAGGYGLGLSIAKKIVDRHRGSITVKSGLEVGTVFTLRLPLAQSKSPLASSVFS